MNKEVKDKFKELRLKACADNLDQVLEQAVKMNRPATEILNMLLDTELETKRKNRTELRYKESKLTEKPAIDRFDFNHHPSRKKQKNRIPNLMTLEFIEQKKDIILIGNPGTGKSFSAKCIACAATPACKKVLFTTTTDMINNLTAAEVDNTLLKKLRYYQNPALLIVDETGYLPLGNNGSSLFFQVISGRHEKESTIITANLPFAEWGNVFDSTTVATAIADRLVSHNSEVLIMEGTSYRKKPKNNSEN